MSEKSDLLSQTKPLADPLRIATILFVIMAVVNVVVAMATSRVFSSLGAACLALGFALLIAPTGRPNALYLRAFRTDKSSAALRAEIAAIMGPDFRLSGIRSPRERTWMFVRFLLPVFFAFKYAGSKFMELEAGDDWMARLWKTYQTARVVLIDVRDMTPYLEQEIRFTLQTVGASRIIFLVNQERTEGEWRQLLAQIIGPETDSAQLRLLDVSPMRLSSDQLESDLKEIVQRLPEGVPGELQPGRKFILDNVSEEVFSRNAHSSLPTVMAAVASLLFWVGYAALLKGLDPSLGGLGFVFVVAAVMISFLLLVQIRGLFRTAVRARQLHHAGHHHAARRVWSMLVLEILLFLATPVLLAVEPVKALLLARKSANETSAILGLRTLTMAEITYDSMYPDVGFTCQLSTLGGIVGSGPPTPEAAQLISSDLASGRTGSYTFVISNCRRTMVNGREVNTGYQITAVPNIVGETGDRGFCTDERGKIFYDPNGGTNCTEPLESGGALSTYVVPESPAVQESTSRSQEDQRQPAIAEVESRMGDRLAEIPSVHRAMEEMLNSPGFQALPREEKRERVQEFGRIHSHAGLRRLDDDALLSKFELDRKMLASAEPASCAAFSRGRVSSEQLHAMLGQLEVSEIERWYDLIVQAEAADVEGVPAARSADPDRIRQSLESIVEALPEKESQKFRRILADYDHASDEEVCWSERTLREGIAGLGRSDRVLWALRIAE